MSSCLNDRPRTRFDAPQLPLYMIADLQPQDNHILAFLLGQVPDLLPFPSMPTRT